MTPLELVVRRIFFALLALVIATMQTVLLVQPASAAGAPTISAPADGSTISDRTPLFEGTYDPSDGGDLVLRIDGVQAYTENAGIPGGATEQGWQFQVPTDLAYGDHEATAVFDGLEGSHGETSITFTIAAPGPAAPLLFDPADGALTGPQVTASGVIADGGTVPTSVRVFVDGSYVGDADLDGAEWRLALPTLSDGFHSVYAVARDDDGNDSDRSQTHTFGADGTAPPVPTITFPEDGYYENVNPTLRGTGEPGSELTIVYEYGTYKVSVSEDGTWEQDPGPMELGEGTHTFSVRQTDEAGNTSATSDPLTYTYDATAPDAPVINAPQNGDTLSDETFIVQGRGEIFATVTVFVDGQSVGTALVDSDSDWTVRDVPSRPAGTRAITATQADRADNESTVSNEVTIRVQLTPPPPVISKPTDDSLTNGVQASDRQISGTAEAGSTVRVLRDGVQIAEVTADQDGLWGYVPVAAFPDGTYELTATATNAAGTSEPSDPVTQTYDTTGPDAPVIESPTPNAFLKQLTFSGTAEPGSRVYFTYQGDVVSEPPVLADEAGRWTLSVPQAVDGEYMLGVSAFDRVGNRGPSTAEVPFTIDTQAPATPVVEEPVDGQRVGTREVPINGRGEPNATVTVRVDGTVVGTTVVGDDGNWQLVTNELDEGDVTLSVTQTDRAGNASPAVEVDVVVDTEAPSAPIVTTPVDGEAAPPSEPVTFSGTAEPGASVTLRLDDADPAAIDLVFTVKADQSGNWQYTPREPLPEGRYTVTAVQTDGAGNVSGPSTSRSLVVDGTAPATPVVTSPAPNTEVKATPTLVGTGEPGATVTVTSKGTEVGTTTVDEDGNWSLVTDELANGPTTLEIIQTDAAGNPSDPLSLPLTVDSTAPSAPVVYEPTQSTTTLLTLTGTGERGSTITVFFDDGGAYEQTTTVDEFGDWTLDVVGQPSGRYTVTATATDVAGNVSDRSLGQVIQVSADPVITVPEEGQIYTTRRPTFEGTGEPGAAIVVRGVTDADLTAVVKSLKLAAAAAPGDVLAIGVVDEDGNWTATPTTDLESGLYSVVAEQTQEGFETRVSEVVDFAVVTKPVITSPADGSEQDDSFLVCGTGEPGFRVEIVDLAGAADDDATVYGDAEVDEDGSWCADIQINTDGAYDLVARQSLEGDFETTSDPISITVDADDSGGGGSGSGGSSSSDSLASTGGPPAAAGLVGLALLGLGGLTLRSRRRFSSRQG